MENITPENTLKLGAIARKYSYKIFDDLERIGLKGLEVESAAVIVAALISSCSLTMIISHTNGDPDLFIEPFIETILNQIEEALGEQTPEH